MSWEGLGGMPSASVFEGTVSGPSVSAHVLADGREPGGLLAYPTRAHSMPFPVLISVLNVLATSAFRGSGSCPFHVDRSQLLCLEM